MIERSFPRERRRFFAVVDFGINRGLSETGSRRSGRPETGMMCGQMPHRSATHGKAHRHDALAIDFVVTGGGFDGFEGIDFAGELAGVAIPPIEMQLESVGWREFAPAFETARDEGHLRKRVVAAME